MTVLLPALASVLLASLASLIGVMALLPDEARLRSVTPLLLAFATGGLLGDAFIHLVPESFAARGESLEASLLVLAGILAFFLVEKLARAHSLVAVNLVGDAIHNMIDGLLIGASWLTSPTLGVSTTLAVLLHELPHELGDFAVLVAGGVTPRRAVLLNLATSLTALVGVLLALAGGALAGTAVAATLVPVTAGGFVYLACADLVPELQRDRSARAIVLHTAAIACGIALMAALSALA